MSQRTVVVTLVCLAAAGAALLAGPQNQPQTPVPQVKTAEDLEFEKGATPADVAGLVKPVLLKDVKPQYTGQAMREKIQGFVDVQVVIAEDGTVARARIATSLDKTYGLDEQALAAAKQWMFNPGTLNGVAVPVLTTVKLQYRIF